MAPYEITDFSYSILHSDPLRSVHGLKNLENAYQKDGVESHCFIKRVRVPVVILAQVQKPADPFHSVSVITLVSTFESKITYFSLKLCFLLLLQKQTVYTATKRRRRA